MGKNLRNSRLFKQLFLVMLFSFLAIIAFACSSENDSDSEATEKSGEVEQEEAAETELIVAMPGEPPTLDPHTSTVLAMADITRGIYETLLTTNSSNEIVPQLAESYEVSDDAKTYTFHLRQGVKFHNGKEMIAEDVVASMNRWAQESSSVPDFLKSGVFEEVDEYTVVLELEEPSVLTLPTLAKLKYYGAVMPKEVIEEAGETGIDEYIGTGPYKFVEWKQAQYVHQEKFEDYQPVDEPKDGAAGKKEALIDDIYFYFVPDSSTLVAGLQTGEYDIALNIPGEYYDQLAGDSSIEPHASIEGHALIFFNKIDGWFTDERMRQAVNAAVNVEEIMLAGFGNPDLFDINSSYEQGFWYSDAGSEYYNEKDLEKAERLLEEAGYDGEPIKVITSRDHEHHYKQAVVIQEQLSKVGMNIELEVYDWPTRNEQLEDPTSWDMSTLGVTAKATPIEHIYLNQDYVNGPEDEKTNDLIHQMTQSETLEEAKEIWDELQGYLWEYLTVIKLGDTSNLSAVSNRVEGYEFIEGPVLWDVTVTE